MSHVDWDKIKAEYLQGGTSYRKLVEKYGVPRGTLDKRARTEEWSRLRREMQAEAETKVRQKIVSQRVKDMEALDRTRTMLIAKLEKSVSKLPDIPGNRMEQTVSDIIPAKDRLGKGGKKSTMKSVRVESDLLKLVSALDKLMELTGCSAAGNESADDGFIEALNVQAAEVTEDDADVPDDL